MANRIASARKPTADEASEICQILDEELDADFQFDPTVAQTFIGYVTRESHAEWRLFYTRGIKFRNGGRHGWRVDCYPEEETVRLRRRLDKANARLAELQARGGS